MFLTLSHEAWISLGTHRLRTFLAMLGIIIGVASVVLMLAVGAGSQRAVEEAVSKLGSNVLVIAPGVIKNKGVVMSMATFTPGDVNAIGQISSIAAVAPSTYNRNFQIIAGKQNWNADIAGTTPPFFSIRNWSFNEGDAFTSKDMQLNKHVAVIGATAANKLFPDEKQNGRGLLGRVININGSIFSIVGVLAPKGQGFGGQDQDNNIFLPIAVAATNLGVSSGHNMINMIFAQAVSSDDMEEARESIRDLLRQRHRIHPYADDDFSIRSLTAVTEAVGETTQALSMLLGAIASISLIVGTIGIMNIMLVNVAERTREIGIRKAIGATERNIMLQFLLEAILITSAGSLLGLSIGLGGGMLIGQWFDVPTEFSLWSVWLSVGVASFVGLASGIYPARKAARLQPIEALRTV